MLIKYVRRGNSSGLLLRNKFKPERQVASKKNMNAIYNTAIHALKGGIKIHSLFNAKSRDSVLGREKWRKKLSTRMDTIKGQGPLVWFHASSLGEFEQGRPVMERLKERMPEMKILLTFFSPSGYNVRRDYPLADIVCYLPFDTPADARDFLDIMHPSAAVFIKYEFWGNFLEQTHSRGIPLYLISSKFDRGQVFFKPWGGFMRKLLPLFTHIFTQDTESVRLLDEIGVKNCSCAGDTRFDRVLDILPADNSLPFAERFKGASRLVVAGSVWTSDEKLFSSLIGEYSGDCGVKFLVAPHNIVEDEINRFTSSLSVPYQRYSTMDAEKLASAKVLVLDTVGILTKAYSYADISYVGGGFTSSGIHNTLEPAVFSRPVICGPNYRRYGEAVGLKECGGLTVISDEKSLSETVRRFLSDAVACRAAGDAAGGYVRENAGATDTVVTELTSSVAV